jgi:hypothetical protein
MGPLTVLNVQHSACAPSSAKKSSPMMVLVLLMVALVRPVGQQGKILAQLGIILSKNMFGVLDAGKLTIVFKRTRQVNIRRKAFGFGHVQANGYQYII